MGMKATCLSSIEDWKQFNRRVCHAFLIIGADRCEECRLWYGLITLIPEDGKPKYYTTEAVYLTRAEAFHMALYGARKWMDSPVGLFEGGCAVPPEELRRP